MENIDFDLFETFQLELVPEPDSVSKVESLFENTGDKPVLNNLIISFPKNLLDL